MTAAEPSQAACRDFVQFAADARAPLRPARPARLAPPPASRRAPPSLAPAPLGRTSHAPCPALAPPADKYGRVRPARSAILAPLAASSRAPPSMAPALLGRTSRAPCAPPLRRRLRSRSTATLHGHTPATPVRFESFLGSRAPREIDIRSTSPIT